MNVAILYNSRTGTTARAAELTGKRLADLGARVSVRSVDQHDIKEMAEADLILLGSWTDGAFIALQRPANMGKFKKLPDLQGKNVGVFCTYKLRAGNTLRKFGNWAEFEGARSVGGYEIKSDNVDEGANELARMMAVQMKLAPANH